MRATFFGVILFLLSMSGSSNAELDVSFLLNPCNAPESPRLKIPKGLAALDKAKPEQRSFIYTEISSAYLTLKDCDLAVNFQEKAASSYSENSSYRQSTTEHGKIVYRRKLAFHYRKLASLEELKAMSLYAERKDWRQARVFDVVAAGHVSNAIVLYRYHESYALRASIESHSCKPDDARADIRTAIELAKRSGNEDAATEYASIDADSCWWGVKDGQPEL